MKLLQWNIWFKEDPDAIIEEVLRVNADIICLQELTIGNSLHDEADVVELIRAATGFQVYFKDMKPSSDGLLANAIFSRFPIADTRHTWINEPIGSGGYDDEYRCLVEADIEINGQTLTVATTHMSYTDRFKETDRKLAETNKLLSALKDKTRTIFTGDLNVTPESNTVQRLSEMFTHAGPAFSEPTWTTKPFEYNGFKAETLDWRLDYVFAAGDVEIKSSEIIQTDKSDHLPILVTFEV